MTSPIARGAIWTVAGRLGQQALSVISLLLLSRILSPNDFGLVAMPTILIGFAGIFADFGLGASIISKDSVTKGELTTLFTLNLAVGCILAVTFVAASPLIAQFYRRNELTSITQCLSITFILASAAVIPSALLQRGFEFKKLAVAELLSTLAGLILGIMMAIQNFGYWSLVGQVLTTSASRTAMIFLVSRWRPGFSFSPEVWRLHKGFSSRLLGSNVVAYWARNVDELLVGRFLGSVEVGLYSRAFMLMMLPVTQIVGVLTKVMFPTMARVRGSKDEAARIYLKSIGFGAAASIPIVVLMTLTTSTFVTVTMGVQWSGVVAPLQAFSVAGFLQVFTQSTSWIYMSNDEMPTMLRWSMINAFTTISFIIIGVTIGDITAIAWLYTLAMLLLFVPTMHAALSVIHIPFRTFLKSMWRQAIAGIVMTGTALPVGMATEVRLAPWVSLVLTWGAALAIYCLLLFGLGYIPMTVLGIDKVSGRRTLMRPFNRRNS